MKMDKDIEVYRAYIAAKSDKNVTVSVIAKKFKITRSTVYDIVKRITKGSPSQLKACTERSRLDCLWQYKYRAQYFSLPKDRKPATIEALKKLVLDMRKDKFAIARISTLIGKDRSTVLHHLEK